MLLAVEMLLDTHLDTAPSNIATAEFKFCAFLCPLLNVSRALNDAASYLEVQFWSAALETPCFSLVMACLII